MQKWLLVILISLLLLSINCVQPVKMEGNSMFPNIKNGERLIINKSFGELKREDVVVHIYPKDQTKLYIKRIIGLPNETIEIREGNVFIDGKKLEENYLDQNYNMVQKNLLATKIEPDNYFVMGDNRDNSSDSRSWGTLKKELIQGVVSINYGNNNGK